MLARRLRLALCAATLVLAVGAAPASATLERFLFLKSGETSLPSSGVVTFSGSEITVRCNLTLSGTLQGAIPPTVGERMGAITAVPSTRCEGETGATFLSFPWSLTYTSFTGTQPEAMTGELMTMRGLSVSLRAFGVTCLYRGDVGLNMALRGRNPYEVTSVATLSNRLSYVSGAICPGSISMTATFTMEPVNAVAELPDLELVASPMTVNREQALGAGGREVRFTPRSHDVRVISARWRETNGWTTEAGTRCTGLIRFNSFCQARVFATSTAGYNRLELIDFETLGVDGWLFVGPP